MSCIKEVWVRKPVLYKPVTVQIRPEIYQKQATAVALLITILSTQLAQKSVETRGALQSLVWHVTVLSKESIRRPSVLYSSPRLHVTVCHIP